MKSVYISIAFASALLPLVSDLNAQTFAHASAASETAAPAPANPRIDAAGFLAVAAAAAKHRETRRVSEADFLRMAREPNTIVLDARSEARFRDLHVVGAHNLSFPDITEASLALLAPDKSTRILIYCNNNFLSDERAFPSKLPSASLNLSTYAALYNHGYRNVYELAPLLDVKTTQLPLKSVDSVVARRGFHVGAATP